MSNPSEKRELLIFFYKYRLRLFLAFAIPFILSVVISFVPTPRYVARSVMIVRLGAEYVYQPEVSSQNNNENIIPFNPLQIFKSEVAILGSEELHAEVIKRMTINKLFPELLKPSLRDYLNDAYVRIGILAKPRPEEIEHMQLARAVELFDKHFDILLEKDSAVITVSFSHQDSITAVKTLDTLINLYLEKRKTIYLESRTVLALSERNASHKRAVTAEHAVQEFKRQNKIYSLQDEREQLLERRDKAEEQASLIASAGLQKRISDYNRQLGRLDSLEHNFNLLQKEAQIANESYAIYSHKYNQAKALEDLESERADSVRVIQPPATPPEPKKLQYYIIISGMFISVISVFFVAAVTEHWRNSFHSPAQVEGFINIPVLAVLKESADKLDGNISHLINRLKLFSPERTNRIITFISARTSEGTSYVAYHYALKLAEERRHKVLLIDAGKPSQERYRDYGLVAKTGIIDAVIDGKTIDAALHEISAGFSACRLIRNEENRGRVMELINDNDFWKDLLEIFGTVIIDTASLQATFDGVTLASKSDMTVMVIRADKTPQAVVKNLYNILSVAGVKIVGAVMNRRCHYIPEKVYSRL